ncbi:MULTISPECIES: Cof-type HAD-IIB family hydrolase [Aerococcus]|uniref:Cof-type HAD-IIB family hydrolase n=1 Tax=Aerococcus TaxID=1375 RepID=UPI000DCC03A3|nr:MULTISPECIES: Cof-type HAD-IIB family hydrolase [Aerococcus]KAA9298987.1 HAD family phosphatase [Aerococcus tenax]MDK6688646.1 Cof-type HAD-IIB family hydrolase [Aerococcus urinae]MDK8133006.1 Cof-type HAD-IIB family hydrolase [Aerococcus urinae]RAV92149.1 hypothetical protein DBT45_04695 [Aerococcus tenax]
MTNLIKLFVTDMDGTLLNDHHVISDANRQAILSLKDQEIEFMVATGRGYHSAQPLLDMQDLRCPMINLNGAVFTDINGQASQQKYFSGQLLSELLDYFNYYSINYSIMTQNQYYLYNPETFIDQIKAISQGDPKAMASAAQFIFDTNYIRDIRDYINGENEPALKVMVFSEDHAILQQFIEHFDSHPELAVSSSGTDNLEITQRDATKGNALMAYAQSKGYQSDEILTIGDSHNDISMFHPVKYSYAMANASQLVKDQANYLAPSNKEDGVAQVIANLLKERH